MFQTSFEWRQSADCATDCRHQSDRNHAHPPQPDPADKDFDALPVEMLEAQTDPIRLRPPGKPGMKLGPEETLDRAGIDLMIANRVSMGPGLPPERFLWVA